MHCLGIVWCSDTKEQSKFTPNACWLCFAGESTCYYGSAAGGIWHIYIGVRLRDGDIYGPIKLIGHLQTMFQRMAHIAEDKRLVFVYRHTKISFR